MSDAKLWDLGVTRQHDPWRGHTTYEAGVQLSVREVMSDELVAAAVIPVDPLVNEQTRLELWKAVSRHEKFRELLDAFTKHLWPHDVDPKLDEFYQRLAAAYSEAVTLPDEWRAVPVVELEPVRAHRGVKP